MTHINGCYGLHTLQSVTIPEGVTHIEKMAFYFCRNLKEVVLPESLQEIGFAAFRKCESLTSVHLPKDLKEIEGRAFEECHALSDISIPEGVTSIEMSAFCACRSLTNVTIPDGITALSVGVFSSCCNLKSVTLPKNLTYIGAACFGACTSLENIKPDSVKLISERAFIECKGLKEITLPSSLVTLGENAFSDCNKALKIHCSGKIFTMLDKNTKDNLTVSFLMDEANYEKEEVTAIQKYAARTKNRLFSMITEDCAEAIAKLLSCGKMKLEDLEKWIEERNDGAHPLVMAVLLDYKNKHFTPEDSEALAQDKIEKEFGIKERTLADWIGKKSSNSALLTARSAFPVIRARIPLWQFRP